MSKEEQEFVFIVLKRAFDSECNLGLFCDVEEVIGTIEKLKIEMIEKLTTEGNKDEI